VSPKVLKRISFLFLIAILLSLNIPKVFAEDDLILRKILTDISWAKTEEGIRINLDYIEIKKVGDQETTSGSNTYFIDATDLKYENLNAQKVDEYLKESGSATFVYHEDIVYGNYLDIFADVQNGEKSEEELEALINEAINEGNTHYEQKDKILAGEITFKQDQHEIKQEGQNPLYL